MKRGLYLSAMLFVITGLAATAYGGGCGPNPSGGCHWLYYELLGGTAPSLGGLPKNQGTTVLGQFIASQDATRDEAGTVTVGPTVTVQVQIAKGNEWYSYEFTAESGGLSLCDFVHMSDEYLLDQFFLLPCEFNIQSEVIGAVPSGYDGYDAFMVSLFSKGWDCSPGDFTPETPPPGLVDGAYSRLTRWGDIKVKFVPYSLP